MIFCAFSGFLSSSRSKQKSLQTQLKKLSLCRKLKPRNHIKVRVQLWPPSGNGCIPCDSCPPPPPHYLRQRHNICEAACNDVWLEGFWLRFICFSPFCSHMNPCSPTEAQCIVFVTFHPQSFCVIPLPPLRRSCYLSLPSLIALVRDFPGPGSRVHFLPFPPAASSSGFRRTAPS